MGSSREVCNFRYEIITALIRERERRRRGPQSSIINGELPMLFPPLFFFKIRSKEGTRKWRANSGGGIVENLGGTVIDAAANTAPVDFGKWAPTRSKDTRKFIKPAFVGVP